MADSHGAHDPHAHGPSKGGVAHAQHEPEEDPLSTPGWMPMLGLGLLMAGALWMYLYISPGVWSTSSVDAGADESAAAPAEAPAPAQPH